MKEDLVFDIGLHVGEDTGYYLSKGFNVVAIDANPHMIRQVAETYRRPFEEARLLLLNVAIADQNAQDVTFYLSKEAGWNSLKPEVANRKNYLKDQVSVKTRTLASLIGQYGCPVYCKIDIEGYDEVALRSLMGAAELPRFISAESECVGDTDELTDEQALTTLNVMHQLGYEQFKLVDQSSLRVIGRGEDFYQGRGYLYKALAKVSRQLGLTSARYNPHGVLSKTRGHRFAYGSSGPFGDDLEGDWCSYAEARELLLLNRRSYFGKFSAKFGFWCDWHARRP